MARVPLRVRLWDQVMRRTAGGRIHELDDDQVVELQAREIGHGAVQDLVFGGLAPDVTTRDVVVDGPDATDLTMRVYTPDGHHGTADDGRRPAVLYLHGGGFAVGTLDLGDGIASAVASRVGAVVVSVAYRLAPLHPFPAAVDDAVAAVEWFAREAGRLGCDADRLAVMGDSAGGNLAAVVALVARDRGGPAIAHQALLYPVVDQVNDTDSRRRLANAPILTAPMMDRFGAMYLQGEDDGHDWRASPLLAESLAGLPPALVQVAEQDPLRDEGIAYARALQAAGVPVRLTEYVGAPHGFHSFPGLVGAVGSQAMAELCTELATALAAG